MENFAENVQSGAVQVGTPVVAPAEQPMTLSDVIGVEEVSTAQQPTANNHHNAENAPPQHEPGWFQGRLQKEQAKWEKKHEAEMTQLRDTQNVLMERLIAREAQDLVDSGEVKSIETAKELLRLRAGLPSAQQTPQVPETPRDGNGRFLPRHQESQADAAMIQAQQRANTLITQADVIKSMSGVDVMDLYNTDPNVKQKIISGEWDFMDALKSQQGQQVQTKQAVPAPIRSSSGIGMGTANISRMNDASFKKMNDFLSLGGVIDMRK